MLAPNRFKPYAPDVHAVVRLDVALPPNHPVHVCVDLIRSISLDHVVVSPGRRGSSPAIRTRCSGCWPWG